MPLHSAGPVRTEPAPFRSSALFLFDSMPTIYLACATVGGALLVIQILLTVFGGDADVDADVPDDVGGSGIGVRTVVAFFTFFGIAGMAAQEKGFSPGATLAIAVLSGAVAFGLVAFGMVQLYRLRSSGTVDINNTVGVEAKVYLTVPAERSGEGRVTVPVQGRTQQYKAITSGPEIPTGQLCRILAVHAADTARSRTRLR